MDPQAWQTRQRTDPPPSHRPDAHLPPTPGPPIGTLGEPRPQGRLYPQGQQSQADSLTRTPSHKEHSSWQRTARSAGPPTPGTLSLAALRSAPAASDCYAKALAERWRGGKAFPNGFDLTLRPHKINEPAKWKAPSLVFVNSMSDLFHKDIPLDYLESVWQTMLNTDRHIYQILTKRPHYVWPTSSASWSCRCRRISGLAPPWKTRRLPTTASLHCSASRPPVCAGYRASHCWDRSTFGLTSATWTGSWTAASPALVAALEIMTGSASCATTALLPESAFYHKQGFAQQPGKDRELDGRTWDQYPDMDHPALVRPRGVGPCVNVWRVCRRDVLQPICSATNRHPNGPRLSILTSVR